ncbi:hypothetical protein JG688_00016529 [Phytophthora aleatoria]|uniref:Uncharacterized protein n=1 Tax=Phytophthora aleatoria TaxID=2496075 RepID=A0A8J5I464_9STRA|nr:hypothetical protein JG688_00016529 [Phytophthora aleatoria]
MWDNHITRKLNRSTWKADITPPPPEYVANQLHSADSRLERHLSSLAQSANTALDCVRVSMAGYRCNGPTLCPLIRLTR